MTRGSCLIWSILVIASLTIVALLVVGIVGTVVAVRHGLGW